MPSLKCHVQNPPTAGDGRLGVTLGGGEGHRGHLGESVLFFDLGVGYAGVFRWRRSIKRDAYDLCTFL